jgi:K+-transporting ATPase KdpF subunit
VHDPVFSARSRLRLGLRQVEVREIPMLGNIILLAISVLTGIYLLAALLWPERF